MDERDEEELRLRAEQLDHGEDVGFQLPTHVDRGEYKNQTGLSEREKKIWEMYIALLSYDPKRNNLEGVQWAADAVDSFLKWVTENRSN